MRQVYSLPNLKWLMKGEEGHNFTEYKATQRQFDKNRAIREI